WRWHPVALAPRKHDPDVGIFSGNAFLDRDGVPTIAYFGIHAGICLAVSHDENLDVWRKHPGNPVIRIPEKGDPGHGVYNVFDPHIWLEGDTYYAALGGKVLPSGERDTLFLFRSQDLAEWEYLHPLYEPRANWTGVDEDCACPDFFPLGGRHALLCISHSRGCRMYLGKWQNETYLPEEHHRMNFPGGTCFAPESLLDPRGRRIFWAWALDQHGTRTRTEGGWSGVMTLPRQLGLDPAGRLRIEPVQELERLRGAPSSTKGLKLQAGQEEPIPAVRGDSLELRLVARPEGAQQVGLAVRRSPDGEEQTRVVCDLRTNRLRIELERSSLNPEMRHHQFCMVSGQDDPVVTAQEAPFELARGEALELRVFLDRSILEVFANSRQCLTQRIYPTRDDSQGVSVFAVGGAARVEELTGWAMAPTNPW
ncbi:MAG: glycoside hydrolase family 32 protein, partial [Armatimonadetes bacterium]|nr:glycoside hydrolase family 32 protein [Armatimonadota bacterium]